MAGAPALLLLGCQGNSEFGHVRAPEGVPKVAMDVQASEVNVLGSTDAEALRPLVATAITETVAHLSGIPRPTRYQATISAGTSSDFTSVGCALLVLPLAWVGSHIWCSYSDYVAKVDLRLEVGDATYVGHGEASHLSPSAVSKDSAGAVWTATVHDGVQDAMLNLKRQGDGAKVGRR